ncbi:MAG: RNA polymerase sigma-70 factor [Bacteroidota bacterium]|nr:RNA polymerase sigma-70 factor [Bacteroidota bacterium]
MEKCHKDLVYNLKNSDSNAFNYFYRSYYKRMFNFANSYLRDSFVAGNIVQDTFMSLWEHREKLDPELNLPAYLLTTVKNKALNHLRRQTVKAKVEKNVENQATRELELRCATLMACDPGQMFHSDVEGIIHKTMESLSPQCKKVVAMSRFEGLTNKEIASRLGVSEKAIEFHISKALKLFRENLKDYLVFILLILNVL